METIDTSRPIWVVRAGRKAAYIDDFVENGLVAIGWTDVGLESLKTRDKIIEVLKARHPERSLQTVVVWAGQLHRFGNKMQKGDTVVSYDPNTRQYHLGTVASELRKRDHHLGNVHDVKWVRTVDRDALSETARRGLGSIATLFVPREEVREELLALANGSQPPVVPSPVDDDLAEVPSVEDDGEREALEERSERLIEDLIARLQWEQLEELVAGVLRAMGYRTRVSPVGPDRGVDIFASPDGLGLEEPRIFVEVKHRKGSMGAPAIRSFLGGRSPGDRCLYVSTGGFTREARYEADRSSVPLRLVNLPDLRELVVENYERLDEVTRSLVPLVRIHWPLDA